MRRSSVVIRSFLTGVLLTGIAVRVSGASATEVVVDSVTQGYAAERAGIHAGDVLVSAKIGSETRRFSSPFDVALAEIEEGGRAPVPMQIFRDGASLEVVLPVESWRVDVRPRVDSAALAAWTKGKEALASGDAEKAVKAWDEVILKLPKGRGLERAALWARAGQLLIEAQRWDESKGVFDAARKALPPRATTESALLGIMQSKYLRLMRQDGEEPARDALRIVKEQPRPSLLRYAALYQVGGGLLARKDLDAAEEIAREGHALALELAPQSLSLARSLHTLAAIAALRPDLDRAEQWGRASLEMYRKAAPDSLTLADGLAGMSGLAWLRGDPVTAKGWDEEALAIVERRLPGSIRLAAALSELSTDVSTLGDGAAAEKYLRRSIAIFEAISPDSRAAGLAWLNLGTVLANRGDLAAAESCYRRRMAIDERNGQPEQATLTALGHLALRRRDLGEAERYFREALTLKASNPLDDQIPKLTSMLATIQAELGQLDEALSTSKRAVELFKALGPNGMDVGMALGDLCTILTKRRDLAEAESACRESLDIFEKAAPQSLDVSDARRGLSDIAVKRGDLEGAAAHLEAAIAASSSTAPDSRAHAEGLHKLGQVRRLQKRPREAVELLRRAIEALEAQTERLGGSEEVRSAFAAEFKSYYVDYIEVLHELGEDEAAFQGTERYRARRFLAMLAERDLMFSDDLPADLMREWREVDADYAQTQGQLSHAQLGMAAADLESLRAHVRELGEQKIDLKRRIREASPRVASLRYPQPLSLEQTLSVLEPQAALLSFVVGESQTLVFVVRHADRPLSVLRIPVGDAVLRAKVEHLLDAIRHQAPQAEVTTAGRALYRDLMAPAEPLLSKSERLLVLADGPLHRLPFSALVRGERAGRPEYLVEWRAIHNVVSATAYAEVIKQRQSDPEEMHLSAFGDPAYPTPDAARSPLPALSGLRSAAGTASGLSRLAYSRREVEAIAALYPRQASVFVGDQATEERAKEQAKTSRYLHFACHGLLDEQFPINSGLVLSVPVDPKPDEDDGVLQAWEIIEKVRLNADLVTLSACETGLGKEGGGEGLVGLTRAFQYAGARSVLASLWSVSDESTAELMKRFYGHLQSGRSKADALRDAQIEMLRAGAALGRSSDRTRDIGGASVASSRRSSHPFHWAAFELLGDWR
jgi:CHAT domain-containing protein